MRRAARCLRCHALMRAEVSLWICTACGATRHERYVDPTQRRIDTQLRPRSAEALPDWKIVRTRGRAA